MADTIVFSGVSGAKHKYWVFAWDTTFTDDKPGNYAITRADAQGRHTVLYFGETESLKSRCCGTHEKWEGAKKLGATHISAHTSSDDKKTRCAEESDLVNRYNPPLNKQ